MKSLGDVYQNVIVDEESSKLVNEELKEIIDYFHILKEKNKDKTMEDIKLNLESIHIGNILLRNTFNIVSSY